jgi:hypothetical protein
VIKPTKAYDPRDPAQALDNPSTWRVTTNMALVTAHLTREQFGERSVQWRLVAIAADHSDQNECLSGWSATRH